MENQMKWQLITTRHQLLLIRINDRQSRNSTTPSKVEVSPSDAEFREVSRAVRFAMWLNPDRLHHSDGDPLLQSTGKSPVRRRRALSRQRLRNSWHGAGHRHCGPGSGSSSGLNRGNGRQMGHGPAHFASRWGRDRNWTCLSPALCRLSAFLYYSWPGVSGGRILFAGTWAA
jgi:hypothetical protein